MYESGVLGKRNLIIYSECQEQSISRFLVENLSLCLFVSGKLNSRRFLLALRNFEFTVEHCDLIFLLTANFIEDFILFWLNVKRKSLQRFELYFSRFDSTPSRQTSVVPKVPIKF